MKRRRDSDFFARPGGAEERQRRAAYALKDSLMTCRDRLAALEPRLADPLQPRVQAIRLKQDMTAAIVAEMLTNNPSEWLEASLAGKMGHDDFMQIPLATITKYKEELVGFMRQVDFLQAFGRAGKYLDADSQGVDAEMLDSSWLDYMDRPVFRLEEWTERIVSTFRTPIRQPREQEPRTDREIAVAAAAESDPFSNGW